MAPLVTRIATALGRSPSPELGRCMVCGQAVREGDDSMHVHGRYVHMGCAGYRLRQRARGSRVKRERDKRPAFTGD